MIKTSLPGPDLQPLINPHEEQITVNQKWSCCFQLPQCCRTKAHSPPRLRVEQQEETFPSLSTISIMGKTLETDIVMKTAQFTPRVTLTNFKAKIERSFIRCYTYFKITVRETKPTAKYSLSFREIFGKTSVNLRQDTYPLVGPFHTHTQIFRL